MRRVLYYLSALIFIGGMWSCEKEDLSIYDSSLYQTKWVSVSETDSIRIEFSSSVSISQYDINVYPPTLKDSKYYPKWSINSKNSITLNYDYDLKPDPKDKKLSYTLKGKVLTIGNLVGNEDRTFYKEHHERSEADGNHVVGSWHTTLSRDSVVLVFENKTMKEYVYEKNTGEVLKYTYYDRYKLYQHVSTYNNKIRITYSIWLYNKYENEKILSCLLDNNQLIIYQNDNPIVYTKID